MISRSSNLLTSFGPANRIARDISQMPTQAASAITPRKAGFQRISGVSRIGLSPRARASAT